MSRSLALGLVLGAGVFTGATVLDGLRNPVGAESDGGRMVLSGLRAVLAAQFTTKADLYFHNGYRGDEREHEPEQEDHRNHGEREKPDHEDEHQHEGHLENKKAAGHEMDWIARFGENFYVSKHAHMDASKDGRELLPWFALAAKANPNRPEPFISGAFWLRTHLKKPQEAAEFLRDGLQHNPGNIDLLVELGRTYEEFPSGKTRAENVFRAALAKWEAGQKPEEKPDTEKLEVILAHLSTLAEQRGDKTETLNLLKRLMPVSPIPAAISKRIAELETGSK